MFMKVPAPIEMGGCVREFERNGGISGQQWSYMSYTYSICHVDMVLYARTRLLSVSIMVQHCPLQAAVLVCRCHSFSCDVRENVTFCQNIITVNNWFRVTPH